MPTANNTTIIEKDGWVFRFFSPSENPSRVLLLLHGWTGDEQSMWQFTHKLPENYAIIAPRAPYSAPADKGGYSWREIKPGTWGAPTFVDLHLSADRLVSLVDFGLAVTGTDFDRVDVVGFSQGGALALTLSALSPERVNKVAVLSGFLPSGVDELLRPNLLNHIHFFWAHGSEDKIIPIERGRESIRLLKSAGANIQFCKADIGHRVSKSCRYALGNFLSES